MPPTQRTCPLCQYDLHGLRDVPHAVCPECGIELPVEPPAAPSRLRMFLSHYWIAMLPSWFASVALAVAAMPMTGVPGHFFLRQNFQVLLVAAFVLCLGWPWAYCMARPTRSFGTAISAALCSIAANIGMVIVSILLWTSLFDALGGS